MKNSKSEEMLIYACGKLAQALDDGKTLVSGTYTCCCKRICFPVTLMGYLCTNHV